MTRRPPAEVEKIETFLKANEGLSGKELVSLISEQILGLSKPVDLSYVNYLRYVKGKPRKAAKQAKKTKVSEPIAATGGGSEGLSFDGFIQKLEDVLAYAKDLRKIQKDRLEKLFF